MHLTLGLGFFFGGINRVQQHFNVTVSQLFGTMLLLAMSSLIIPTVITLLQTNTGDDDILKLSRAICVILLLSYFVFLYFSLRTHAEVFNRESEKVPKREMKPRSQAFVGAIGAGASASQRNDMNGERSERDEDAPDEPQISLFMCLLVLVLTTALLVSNTAFATDSLNGLVAHTGLTDTFIGIVLLPLLSVDFTVIGLAVKDRMDSFISLTVGKCLQTALLVIPFIVILGWMMGVPMGLNFDAFEVVALFASVMYINSMIQDGRSH